MGGKDILPITRRRLAHHELADRHSARVQADQTDATERQHDPDDHPHAPGPDVDHLGDPRP